MTRTRPSLLFVLLLPALISSAFLTEIRLIPAIANNVGLFEVIGGLTIVGFLMTHPWSRLTSSSFITIVALITAVALVSLVNAEPGLLTFGLIQVSILGYLLLYLLVFYNIFLIYQIRPSFLLRWITIAAAIVGPWILRQGFLYSTDLEAVGPFRNRSHMGIYMLTAFWLVLIYTLWPNRGSSKWIKAPICLVAISLSLYAVGISGRRSVYLSLFIGLAGLALVFIVVLKRNRLRVGIALLVSLAFLGLLSTPAGEFLPRSDFFRERVLMIGDRLQGISDAVSGTSEGGFMAMQAEGIRAAVHAHPVLGIGWGTFYKFSLNPSRHEVHSTPLKFLAETGVIGFMLYVLLLLRLVYGSGELALRMRGSPYAASYLVLAVAISSLSISYMYNRHLTERTFWLLLLVFLVLEAFAEGYERAQQSALTRSTAGDRRPSEPREGAFLPKPLHDGA